MLLLLPALCVCCVIILNGLAKLVHLALYPYHQKAIMKIPQATIEIIDSAIAINFSGSICIFIVLAEFRVMKVHQTIDIVNIYFRVAVPDLL